MKRSNFLKNVLLGTGILVAKPSLSELIKNDIDEISHLNEVIGFNHIPITNSHIMENAIFHKADSRGNANHGWLNSHHSFSFANYYNPERMHFGVLRVLNDDTVSAGEGFGKHPHDNMEIISIPLSGTLQHHDSMGNKGIIKSGDIQVMSAGTGIQHSEYNASEKEEVKFLQIWVIPNKKNVTPRYDQISLDVNERKNKFQQILSPSSEDAGVWIHQNAWFNLASLEEGKSLDYSLHHPDNGIYFFVISGTVTIEDQTLNQRDALGFWSKSEFSFSASKDAEVLVMEVPMKIS